MRVRRMPCKLKQAITNSTKISRTVNDLYSIICCTSMRIRHVLYRIHVIRSRMPRKPRCVPTECMMRSLREHFDTCAYY